MGGRTTLTMDVGFYVEVIFGYVLGPTGVLVSLKE